ncbi:hypothetical protein [Rhodococcus sp. OK302]|uniref:hypothetical protein n=1 Tax=Rhodococcus sp. OK302 TaxID=1882769 RepID=UPI000B94526A|nr:hypothetical protein [Rhodococcus sp. OK302]OYD61116.1 hypothetical protein BDB13_6059 [Rhodococcus sp. OK302]
MRENNTPRERFKVEMAARQATKRAQVLTDMDLAAVVEGLTGEKLAPPRIDDAFRTAKVVPSRFD